MSTEADQARRRRINLAKHAVKTGLAAFAAYHLTLLMGMDMGYWAVISTIIVMQADLGGALSAGLNRLAGTVAGAAIAVGGMVLFGPSSWLLFGAVTLAIGVCALTPGLRTSYRMAGVTVAIVILAAPESADVAAFGAERCLEIVVGVAVAMAVALLIWPSRAQHTLKRELGEQFGDMADMTLSLTAKFLGDERKVPALSMDELAANMAENREMLFQARREASLFGKIGIRPLFFGADRLQAHLKGMDRLAGLMPADGYQTHCAGELRGVAKAAAAALRHMGADLGGRPEAGARPEVGPDLQAAEARLLELRTQGTTQTYPLTDITTFFSFYQHLRGLGEEVARLADEARRLKG